MRYPRMVQLSLTLAISAGVSVVHTSDRLPVLEHFSPSDIA